VTRSLGAVDVTTLPAAEWDALAVRSPAGEALQSHAWGEVKRVSGWDVRRYRLVDGTTTIAVASIQERDLVPRRMRRLPVVGPVAARAAGRFLYAPTGPVVLDGGADARVPALRALRDLARQRAAALIVVDPAWSDEPDVRRAFRAAGFRPEVRQVQVSRTGMVVPLDADEATQHARIGDSVARNINRARKKGVVTHRVSGSSPPEERASAVLAFDAILEATARRHGLSLRGREYRLGASRALLDAGVASLWFARGDGRDLAATSVHECGARLVSFQAGEPDTEERNRLPANYALQWAIIRWAAEAGFREYDLGGVDTADAPGIPTDERHPLWGLFQFKLQWGARPTVYAGAYGSAPSIVRGALVRGAWLLRAGRVGRRGETD
jgi:lipid II:glycine glycyltransferase (peptidoglycan interpeptide bridge formation enzyme)